MTGALFIFLLALLNTWCAASNGMLTPYENGCTEDGISDSGTDSGSGGDDVTITPLCSATTHSTYVPQSQPIYPLPNSLTLASSMMMSSEAGVVSSEGVPLHFTPTTTYSRLHVPTIGTESGATSLPPSLLALVSSYVLATVSDVTSIETSVSPSNTDSSLKVVTATTELPNPTMILTTTGSTIPLPTLTIKSSQGLQSFLLSSPLKPQLSTSADFTILLSQSTAKTTIKELPPSSSIQIQHTPTTPRSYDPTPVLGSNSPTHTLITSSPATPSAISPGQTPSTYTFQTLSTTTEGFALLSTLHPYSAPSPSDSMTLTIIEVTETPHSLQMSTQPPLLPSSDMVTPSPPQTLKASSAEVVTQSKAVPTTTLFVGTPTEGSSSAGSGPAVSVDVGVTDVASAESSTPTLYTAVGGSVGGCVLLAAIAIGIIAVGAVLHKRRRRTKGTLYTMGAISRRSSIADMSAGLYLPLSQIDGPLTVQLSTTSLLSATTMTPTTPREIETKMFDETLDTAYKSSTFQRSKRAAVSKSGSRGQEAHKRAGLIADISRGVRAYHTRSASPTPSSEEDSESHNMNPRTGSLQSEQPPTSCDEGSVESVKEKGLAANSSQGDKDGSKEGEETSRDSEDVASGEEVTVAEEKGNNKESNEYLALDLKDERRLSVNEEFDKEASDKKEAAGEKEASDEKEAAGEKKASDEKDPSVALEVPVTTQPPSVALEVSQDTQSDPLREESASPNRADPHPDEAGHNEPESDSMPVSSTHV